MFKLEYGYFSIVFKMDLRINCEWLAATKTEKTGKITIRKLKKRIGYINFSVLTTQINVDDLFVHPYYRRKGLGRLLMNMIMSMATEMRKPILLISTHGAETFYISLNMRQIYYHKDWQDIKVTIENLNPRKKFCEQCSDLDYVWVPKDMREISVWI